MRLGFVAAAGRAGRSPLRHGSSRQRKFHGRLAAVFFAGAGVLGLVRLRLPVPGLDTTALTAIATTALLAGVAIALVPWEKWPPRASLIIAPLAFTLISLANVFGGWDLYKYGNFFVVVFVWIGLAYPRLTSVAMLPLAATAYMLPLFLLPGSIWAGLISAAITMPVCVLVGEVIAWGMARLEQIERALQRERDRTRRLREREDMKQAFLSAASHELRTPITVCRGHLDVLADGAGEEEVRAVKETLVDELTFMDRLVNDLTSFTQLDDRALLRMESLPLGSFVKSVATKAEPLLGDRLLAEFSMPDASLHADPQRLTQALLNLLRNAGQHARGTGPVRLRASAGPAHWLFEVADEGGGLPPGEEQLVFEPFRTGSARTGGTGLGLTIARKIARAHGGDAGVVSEPGRGATFWVRIPR